MSDKLRERCKKMAREINENRESLAVLRDNLKKRIENLKKERNNE